MKLSELKALISQIYESSGFDEQIASLDTFINESADLAKEGRTHSGKIAATDDPEVSIKEYTAYADRRNNQKNNAVRLPDKQYLNGNSPGRQLFEIWRRNDQIRMRNLKSAESQKQNLDSWLKSEFKKIEQYSLGNIITQYDKDSSLENLSTQLETLSANRIATPKPGPQGQIEFERQEAAIQYIALLIGYKNALKTLDDHAAAKERNPTADVDIYLSKRHEASENFHKGFGLNRDTGLTAVDASHLTKQTQNDLHATQLVHTAYADALKGSGLISHIKQHVSPVRRAWQTAVKAFFKPHVIDETIVSSVNCETKHGMKAKRILSLSAGTKGENKGMKQMKEAFEDAGFDKNKIEINSNAFKHLPHNDEQQNARVGEAVKDFFLSPSPKPGSTLHVQVSHGGVIFDQQSQLDQICLDNGAKSTLPTAKVGMKFGDCKVVMIARDQKGNILEVSGGSTFSRNGIERPAAKPTLMKKSEFRKKTKMSEKSEKPEEIKKIEATLKECWPSSKKDRVIATIFRRKNTPTTEASRAEAFKKLERRVAEAISASKEENSNLRPYMSVLNKLNKQVHEIKNDNQIQQQQNKVAVGPDARASTLRM